jgi:DNA repair protein RecO (recombination protein O)
MQWLDQAIIISIKKFGENSAILHLLSMNHGLFKGAVPNISSKRSAYIYQIGNVVDANWKARLPEQLGSFKLELLEPIAAYIFDNKIMLQSLSCACTIIDNCLAERHPEQEIYNFFYKLILKMKQGLNWQFYYVLFELNLLSNLGFGLDFSCCAVTGSTDDLVYISPKTGRAVTKNVGAPYKDKLLLLPKFLLDNNEYPSLEEISLGLELSGYFLNKYFIEHNKIIPPSRSRLIKLIKEQLIIAP